MRGIESHGMLLAADYTENGKECVEVLTAPWAAPGTPVIPEGADEKAALEKPAKIDFDKLEKIVLNIKAKHFQVGGVNLTAAGKPITTEKAADSAAGPDGTDPGLPGDRRRLFHYAPHYQRDP